MSKGIDKKLDDIWRRIVLLRAGSKCEYCENTTYLNAHHIFGRRNKSVRWVLANGVALCPLHHTFSSTFSAHQAPLEFVQWLIASRGEHWYNELRELANTPKKWTKNEKEILLKKYKQMFDTM